jgi:two-component sensor histidine kinase
MEDSLLLTVKDNGPGIPDGFDIQRAKSTGLWLVSRLALQIHGRYEYAYDAGAVFKIYFNQSQYINS